MALRKEEAGRSVYYLKIVVSSNINFLKFAQTIVKIFLLVRMAQNTLMELLFKCPFGKLYRKPLPTAGGFPLAGTVVGGGSLFSRPEVIYGLKLSPHVAFER
jgi:hypothetical protein